MGLLQNCVALHGGDAPIPQYAKPHFFPQRQTLEIFRTARQHIISFDMNIHLQSP